MRSFSTEKFRFIDFTEMNGALTRKVWECRNLPEIRKWMVNPDPIAYEDHIRFIDGLKNKNNVRYYVVLYNDALIGSVNIHIENDGVAERGIYIHPHHWGKGFAKTICRYLYSYIHRNMGINTVTTKVMKDNLGSNSLECSLGASESSREGNLIYYSCDIESY